MIARFSAALSRHGYPLAVVAIALSTTVFLPGRDSFAKGQWALLYLLIILLVASVAGTGPGLLTAVLAFFAWNFFFLPPYHTLRVHDSSSDCSSASRRGACANARRERSPESKRPRRSTASAPRS
jgi:K+-sensing histidine kinase KdpD